MLIQRARDSLAYVVYCNLVGGQDELVFDGYSLVVDPDGELMARGTQFEEELIVCDIDPSTAEAARLRDARHRPATRHAASRGRRSRPVRRARPPRFHGGRRAAREAARPRRRGVRGAVPGAARLRGEELVRGRAAGPLGRDRLRSHRLHRGRRARLGEGALRGDALPPLLRGDAARCAHAGRQPRDRTLRVRARAVDAGIRARRSERCSPGRSPAWPRRTSRRGSAGTC